MKKIYSGVLSLGLIALASNLLPIELAQAQTCIPDDTFLEVFGYAETDRVGRIYMSTDSWNDQEAVTTENFAVTYNATTNRWNGTAWSEQLGWVDFGEVNTLNTNDQIAEFSEIRDNLSDWGNWNKDIYLAGLSYDETSASFQGLAANGDYTISGSSDTYDVVVGAGAIDFSNVQLISEACPVESVNVTLNNQNSLSGSCDISNPTIRWTTENIVSGSCVATSGAWSLGSIVDQNLLGTSVSSITNSNSPQIFTIRCNSSSTPGAYVYGSASASCSVPPSTGACPPEDPSCNEVIIPNFQEV